MKTKPSDSNRLRRAAYVLSAHHPKDWPDDTGSEVAFAGRSNVGKSSALNAITGQNRLARTSKTPGRTQQINFFSLDNHYRLVDLPGYGYAKVPRDLQIHWAKTVQHYFEKRSSLRGLILPIDIRRGTTTMDQQMLAWCQSQQLPVHVLLTKCDKLKRGAMTVALREVSKKLAAERGVTVQLFSATRGDGVEEARQQIMALLQTAEST
ncbi:MAG: ribosome biogenesis GTP-binding protein YihA/YsxC [Pseudomonadota bacterium]|nr:ribosome biogenesis GTP-binding protein YihA/YsxC [Pseudomonadota bacterium]MEE3293628.1 ribosome biogenesis GTP-binding protein YihA/YsxC [Pseudomonadota bacterium]